MASWEVSSEGHPANTRSDPIIGFQPMSSLDSSENWTRPSGRKPRPKVAEDKRKRAARACDECRRKKEKCDGKPPCGRCARYRLRCRFTGPNDSNASEKSPEAVHDISVILEPRLAASLFDYFDKDRAYYLNKILAHYLTTPSGEAQTQRHTGRDAMPINTQHSTTAPPTAISRIQEAGKLPDSSKFSPGVLTSRAESLEDLSLNAFTQKITSAIGQKLPLNLSEETQTVVSGTQPSKSWDTELQIDALHAALTCFPPRQIAQFLLDVFFRYLQTSIYYVEETWAYDFLDRCCPQPAGITAADMPGVCTLLMVMACATQFAHLESFQLTEDMSNDRDSPPHFSEDDIGQKFHQAARTLMPYILTAPSLLSVQACLMMATYNFPLDSAGASHVYLSLGLTLGVQQGMHLDRDDEAVDAKAGEVRRRSWWTVYILHLQSSIKYGRPKFLPGHEISLKKPVDLPELRPSREVSSFANQSGLIELTLMTQKIMDEISALRRTNQPTHFPNLLALRQNLIEWWDNFIDGHQAPNSDTDPRCLRNAIHLRLYYYNTRITLGRPFLLAATTEEATPEGSEAGQRLGLETLVRDTVEAAMEVINLCQTLRDRVGLARASYITEFTSCRTAMLVLLAQSIAKPSQQLREVLSRGLAIIKIMAIGSTLASSEAKVIEVLERAVIRLEGAARQKARDSLDPRAQDKSNYDTFKTWTRLWQPSSGFTPLDPSTSPASATVENEIQNSESIARQDEALHQFEALVVQEENSMYWGLGSFPSELSQFDVIPGFDLGLGRTNIAYEPEYDEMLLDPRGLSGGRGFTAPYQE
ncbi:hypothetical protein GQ53DRAFT_889621 [Thozetella sp. PMI_491]|nr:hypothetical protein GQ53DRAFT_889621 [Thozetella sp. PMI_491]